MIVKLAVRNLFHDRARFLVTLVGILFAVLLVAIQLGMFFGARRMITAMIERANADIWIGAYGADSIEQGLLLSGQERYTALAVPGVKSVAPLIVSFAEWRKSDSSTAHIVVVGSNRGEETLDPWNVVEGSKFPTSPDGVIVDRSYASKLGAETVGAIAEIEGHKVRVEGFTEGIRSFTTSPYVFTSLSRAHELTSVPKEQANFFLVKLAPGADVEQVSRELKSRLGKKVYVSTKEEFRQQNLTYWLFGTGAGGALIGGTVLALIVGIVIVAQTLYSSTKDHLSEFATLRALGSSAQYIHKVILTQAAVAGIVGWALGAFLTLLISIFGGQAALPIVFNPALAAFMLVVTLAMCAISAVSSIIKVTRIDPAMVFNR
jgi:putative ABC transport system permease protein